MSTPPRRVILLGPQRATPIVDAAVESLRLDPKARIVAVTAGWEEREPEDLELGEHLGGRVVNLGIYSRGDDVYRRDPELHQALRERHDKLRRLQDLYRLRLAHALEAARELLRLDGDPALLGPERTAAIEAVRMLDQQHLEQQKAIHAEYVDRWHPDDRDAVVEHRHQLAKILDDTGLLCVAGGHVGILVNRVRLFDLMSLLGDRPVIGWSAGAMALTQRIVLFHDHPPQGAGDAEVFGPALGICDGIVPLPHASQRLQLDDPTRVSIFARRFQPDLAVALDARCRVDRDGEVWCGQPGTRQLAVSGELLEVGGPAC